MDFFVLKNQLDFTFTDDKDLLEKLKKEYTRDGYTPDIEIKGDVVHVHINEKKYEVVRRDFDKAMDLCNRHEFKKAETLLREIIKKNPYFCDAHRTLAQVRMEQGDIQDAFDKNIEALRLDPTNLYALLLMGNICIRMGDLEGSKMYYEKVLECHPDNPLALNNAAGNLLQRQQFDKAIEIFNRTINLDDTYLNSYYGLALAYYKTNKPREAFEVAVKGMKKGIDRPQDRIVRNEIQKLAMTVARQITADFDYEIEIGKQTKKLESLGTKPIRLDRNAKNLPVSARLEYSVAHHRDYELIKINPDKKYHEHLTMHEMKHLEMYLNAKALGRNKLIMSGQEELDAFTKWINPQLTKLRSNFPDSQVKKIINQLHNGIMVQAMNSPLDLFVEAMIYEDYPEMRPLQMLSLVDMYLENIESVEKASKSQIPQKVVSANRIMNIVGVLQLQDLYGFNLAPHFKPSPAEMRTAKDLYEEWEAYKNDSDFKAGDEYELLEYFVESLGLDKFFTMVDEMHFNDLLLPNKEDLPLEATDPEIGKAQNDFFQEQHPDGENPAETMMMSMYMLGALKELKAMPESNVHRIALEIAMVGMTGINPKNKGYKINAMPGREFGGYEFLAYYYVSWAIAIPHKVKDLGLPFSNAYAAALDMYNAQQKN